ncbi:MAG: hypothetical protein RIQ33_1012 [Bacteroidota bacterium]
MKSADLNINLIDTYIELLKNLSTDNKLELIAQLSKSMKAKTKQAKVDTLQSLYGSLISKQSADEMIAEIKKDRTFKSKRVEF